MADVAYIHIRPGAELPVLPESTRVQAVVIVDSEVEPEWRHEASKWLVAGGCRYMMAWGLDCSAWDDSVDWAALELFDFYDGRDIGSDPDFVMTTWHENEPLEEVLAFSRHCAWDFHKNETFKSTILVHIAAAPQTDRILRAFEAAETLWSE